MGCNCKNGGSEQPKNENEISSISIKDYIIRFILFSLLVPFMIPITIGVFFYVIVINKCNFNGHSLIKIIVKVLKNSLKNDYDENDEDDEEEFVEFNEDNYELDEIVD